MKSVILLMASALLLASASGASGAEKFWFEPVGFSSTTLVVGTTGVHLIKAKAINEGTSPYDITVVTVSYSGASSADIQTVRFYEDADGDWNTSGDRLQRGGNQTLVANKAIFQGFTIGLTAGATKYLFVTVDLSTTVTDENKVDGTIESPDITTTAPESHTGIFPLKSLSTVNPHRINVIATQIVSTPTIPSDFYAGVVTTFTVKAVDSYGNVDKGWKDSTLYVEAVPGSEPGNSSLGDTPVYSGSGVWLDSEDGLRAASVKLFKAETNRKIRFRDSVLGSAESGFITVQASSTARAAIKSVSNRTAGAPFQITIYTTDAYGNDKTGHSGSVSSISGNAVIGAAPDGTAAVLPADYTWLGTEPDGQKSLAVTLYKQYTGGVLSVSDNQLAGSNSNTFNVAAGTVTVYKVTADTAGPYNAGTSVSFSAIAYDDWLNNASYYVQTASVTSTDENATLPSNPSFSAGLAAFAVTLRTVGAQGVTLREVSNPEVLGSTTMVIASAATARVAIKSVSNQTAGSPFQITIYTADSYGNPTAGHSGSISSISGNAVIGTAPDGATASLPANYTWLGSEPSGEKALSVTLYKQYTNGTLSVSDNQLPGANSNSFNVAAGTVVSYTLAPTVAGPYNSGTVVSYNALAYDNWRNNASNYNLAASVTCTDTSATLPANPIFSAGAASFSITLMTAGAQTLTLSEAANPSVAGSATAVTVSTATFSKFGITVPTYVKAGEEFDATIKTQDESSNTLTSCSGWVTLSVDGPARITPNEVYINAGTWSGKLKISAETLNMRISVTGWGVTTRQAQATSVEVPGYIKARSYPTIFNPAKENLKIRYYLTENRDVKILIYEDMLVVREMTFAAGTAGGRAGLNVVEWDGRSALGLTLISGDYDAVIDKGYQKERVLAVIKNF